MRTFKITTITRIQANSRDEANQVAERLLDVILDGMDVEDDNFDFENVTLLNVHEEEIFPER